MLKFKLINVFLIILNVVFKSFSTLFIVKIITNAFLLSNWLPMHFYKLNALLFKYVICNTLK